MSKPHTRLSAAELEGLRRVESLCNELELMRRELERKPLNDARIKRVCALLDDLRSQAAATIGGTLHRIPTEVVLWDSVVPGFRARCFFDRPPHLQLPLSVGCGGRKVTPRTVKIGDAAIGVAAGRAAARVFAGGVAKGKDPAQERAEERRHAGQAPGRGWPPRAAAEGARAGQLEDGDELAAARDRAAHAGYVGNLSRNDLVTAIDALIRIGKRGVRAVTCASSRARSANGQSRRG